MSDNPTIFVNHNIQFDSLYEFGEKLSLITKMPYHLCNSDEDDIRADLSKDYEGWIIDYLGEAQSDKTYDLVSVHLWPINEDGDISFLLGKYCFEISASLWKYRYWSQLTSMFKQLVLYKGIESKMLSIYGTPFWGNREMIREFFVKFGATQLVLFNGDEHDFWLDHLGAKDFKFEHVVDYCKANLNVVDFGNFIQMDLKDIDLEVFDDDFCLIDNF